MLLCFQNNNLYIWIMRKTLLFILISALFLFFLASCTPEEEEQFKPLVIRVKLAEPIEPPTDNYINTLTVHTTLGYKILSNQNSNDVGKDVVEFEGTAVPNTNVQIVSLIYQDYSFSLGADCNVLTIQIIYDGVEVFTESKEMGYITCPDGQSTSANFTVQ